MKKRPLVLHIGTEKTGTTSIQEFLALNRPRLKEAGILYPESLGPTNHTRLAAYASHEPWQLVSKFPLYTQEKHIKFKKFLNQELHNELALAACGQVVISNEHLHSRLRETSQIAEIKSFLAHFFHPIKVLVYFRRQDLMACSHYSTALKAGSADAKRFKASETNYYYHFFNIHQNWAGVFGPRQVTVRVFAKELFKNGNLIDDFCANADISHNEKFLLPQRRNEALSLDAEMLILVLNNQQKKGRIEIAKRTRKQLINHIIQCYKGEIFYPEKKVAVEFYHRYKESNALLESVLNGCLHPMFNEDFSMYPDKIDRGLLPEKRSWARKELRQLLKNF